MGFQTPQYRIATLLEWAGSGKLQLPDFQREYRWSDDRIRELLVTILRGHPMGVIMLLQSGNERVRFKPKTVTGVESATREPDYLLLDGQQRVTSMYQALTGDGVVTTVDAKNKRLTRRYFLDVVKATGDSQDQDEAVRSLPADGVKLENFGRDVELDVSSVEKQYEHGLMPLTELFGANPMGWLLGYMNADPTQMAVRAELLTRFSQQVVTQVSAYEIPAIELDSSTTKEAVATVFEKVNTGGLPLDTFELLTATFAGDPGYFAAHGEDFRLGEDWKLVQDVLARHPVLGEFSRLDYLGAVSLLASRARRLSHAGDGRAPAVTARRIDILRLELEEFLTWAPQVREALEWVARFYSSQHIHTSYDVPYRTQTIPLAVLRVVLDHQIDIVTVRQRIRQWYWCGVLGELYGSTTETRFARDTEQVPDWALAAMDGRAVDDPVTVKDAGLFESRLVSLRTRGSAAYKGFYALLMSGGPKDWMYDQEIGQASYLDLQIDIHHVFPRDWCLKNEIEPDLRESIVNKTPLAKKTNIFLRGESPARYLPRLEAKTGLDSEALDATLRGHLVDPSLLRAADFHAFFEARRNALIALAESAMGKAVFRDIRRDTAGALHGDEEPAAYEAEEYDADEDSAEDVETVLAELGEPTAEGSTEG
ncbi:GmrSD restriction endonuclease domain-containing protein [Miniimonas arenae]|uniref:GmrSD restriction endonuclease domain-containing protein n=1 Tax=Miniimonas arenae TaxID=676201 RepID=UPI0028ADC5B4|nr:DUF262 domain-containing protein [Miniimonas arenae]